MGLSKFVRSTSLWKIHLWIQTICQHFMSTPSVVELSLILLPDIVKGKSPYRDGSKTLDDIYIYIYIYVCVCVCVCVHIYIYIYIYSVCVCVYVYVCVCVCDTLVCGNMVWIFFMRMFNVTFTYFFIVFPRRDSPLSLNVEPILRRCLGLCIFYREYFDISVLMIRVSSVMACCFWVFSSHIFFLPSSFPKTNSLSFSLLPFSQRFIHVLPSE